LEVHLSDHERGQIEWFEFGDSTADQLTVICHAAATGAQAYSNLAAALVDQSTRVIVPNLCGYGRTQLSPLSYGFTLADHLSVIEFVSNYHSHAQLHLVGHSMGGLVAYQLAERLKSNSLTLIEPMIFSVLDPQKDQSAIAMDRDLVEGFHRLHEAGRSEEGVKIFIEAWNGVLWHDMPDILKQRITNLAPQLYNESKAVTFDQHTKLVNLPTCPLYLLEGRNTLLPAQAIVRRLREDYPDAKYSLIENEGHMGPLFNPAVFSQKIKVFCKEAVAV
jgi:pimeloyl-ACP methyl ester carboxylesterase